MRFRFGFKSCNRPAVANAKVDTFAGDERGTTGLEFALVIGPFLFLLFGIMSVGLYFFVMFSLEHAVESAARLVRTGQAQSATAPMTVDDFKAQVCSRLPSFMNCSGAGNKIRINVQTYAGYGSVTVPSCVDSSGALIASTAQTYNPGGASTIVLVSACYEWELGNALANVPYWISPANAKMTNGSTLIQASTTFTTEPF